MQRKWQKKIIISKIIVHKRRFFYMKKRYSLLFFIIIFLTFSCKKIDAPAYLIISADDLKISTANFNEEHELDKELDNEELAILRQQDFTEVLISLNGRELGYWHLPCTIPLMPDYTKDNNIRITPCTRVPNVTLNSVPYHFLLSEERILTLEKEGEYRLSDLNFKYAPTVKVEVLETFIQTSSFKPRDTIYTASMEIYKEENVSMGRIALEDSVDFFNVVLDVGDNVYVRDVYTKMKVRRYWEMNYYCDMGEITTYLEFPSPLGTLPQQDMIVLPASKSWKKIYIDITEIMSMAAGSSDKISLRLGMRGLKKSENQNAYFYFKNVKLITMLAPY